MEPVTLTEEEADLLAHTIGWDKLKRRGQKPFRNYFAAGAGDLPAWQVLVDRGLARCFSQPREGLPYHYFAVTPEGVAALFLHKKVKVSASRIALIVAG